MSSPFENINLCLKVWVRDSAFFFLWLDWCDLTDVIFQRFGQPIQDRHREQEDRPRAFEEMGKKIQLYLKAVELYKQKVKTGILFSILSSLSIFEIFWIALMSEKALSCYCVLVISYFRNIEPVLFLWLNHQSLKISVRCSDMMLRPFTMPLFLCELLHHCSVGIVLITFPVLPFPYSIHSIFLV